MGLLICVLIVVAWGISFRWLITYRNDSYGASGLGAGGMAIASKSVAPSVMAANGLTVLCVGRETPASSLFVWPPILIPVEGYIAFPLWVPFLISAAPTVVLWYHDRRRAKAGHCRTCNYNLTGNTTGICPECGTTIADLGVKSGSLNSGGSKMTARLLVIFAIMAAGCSDNEPVTEKSPPPPTNVKPQSRSVANCPPVNSCELGPYVVPSSQPEVKPLKTKADFLEQTELASNMAVEKRLSKWQSRPENEAMPDEAIRDRAKDISGTWVLGGDPRDQAFLTIRRLSEMEYDVDYRATGCLARWRLKRTGIYTDGILKLNRPVETYHDSVFDKLYSVKYDGLDYLVTATRGFLGRAELFRKSPMITVPDPDK